MVSGEWWVVGARCEVVAPNGPWNRRHLEVLERSGVETRVFAKREQHDHHNVQRRRGAGMLGIVDTLEQREDEGV